MQGVPDPGSAAAAIEFRAVTKRYPGREAPAVRELSLSVPAGDICVLIGPSGSGKTTAMKMVNRLIDITEGDITIGEQSVRSLDLTELRRGIGYVFQQIGLFPHMSVEDNIGTVPRLLGWDKQRIRARVGELLELVGLEQSDAKRYPGQFSGGQRQRIGVARALAVEPEFIVADEPISALDVSIQAQVINLLEELQDKFKLTYLFIAHDLSVVRHISDRVAVMYLGKIVELADRIDLYEHPLHPYSQALLSAVPIPDPVVEVKRKRIILTGDVPSPVNPPTGCRFHTRCWKAQEICSEVDPEFIEHAPRHWAACHFPGA
jgi:oligopeptide/dipeptide ABC transporter ATP-binding protein